MSFSNIQSRSFLAWFCITMFYCYQYILRPLPNLIMPNIISKYGISAAEFGTFNGLYYIGYIIVHIPIGILLSRFGGRKILPLCILCASIGLAPIIYCDSWWSMIVGRILTGVGSSAASIGALQIFRILYPKYFARAVGLMVSLGLVMAVYISGPISQYINLIGLDIVINILLFAGIALAVITYFLMPQSLNTRIEGDIWQDIKTICCNYKIVLLSVFGGLMIGPLEGFADAWGSAFLVSSYGIERVLADSVTFSMFLGMCIGCIVIPYIVDKTQAYFLTTIICGIGMGVCFVYMLSLKVNSEYLYYICILIGILSAYQVVVLAQVSKSVSHNHSGMAAAVSNMIIMAFGWVFHQAIGISMDYHWNGEMFNGIRSYDNSAFIYSISIIPFGILIAVIGLTSMSWIYTKNLSTDANCKSF